MSDDVASSASASTRSAATRACSGLRDGGDRRPPCARRRGRPLGGDRLRRGRLGRRRQRRHLGVRLGLTGLPFINVKNGCATGGSALTTAHAMLVSGQAEVALVVGFDKHPPGAFNPLPEEWGIGSWYGETGLMLTTQFFAMKIQRYMAEYAITASTLAKVASKAFENGSRNPNAWRRQPLSEDEVLASKMVNHPLTQYMFCSPGEGAVALVLARGAANPRARPHAGLPAVGCLPHAALRLVRGLQPVDPDRVGAVRRRPRPRRRRSSRPASGPRTSTSPSSRTPSPAPRSCTSPRPACASTASRRR